MKNNQQGFSLVEVLVAIAIFGTLLLVIITPMLNSYKMVSDSKVNIQGSAEASRDLEKARQVVVSNYTSATNIQQGLNALGISGLTCRNVNVFNEEQGDCSTSNTAPLRQLTLTRAIGGKNIVLKVSVSQ